MGYFTSTLTQVLSLFAIIIIGYILYKADVVPKNTDTVLSRLLSLVMLPALCFKTLISNLTADVISYKWPFLVFGLAAVSFSYIIAILLSRIFTRDKYQRHIYVYSFTIANLGYMGYTLIGSVFGSEMLANMLIFAVPFNIFIYTIGYSTLRGYEKVTLKSLVNPVCIALLLGAVIGLTGIKLPAFVVDVADTLGDCMGPTAMLVTGFVIAQYKPLDLLKNYRIYIASVLRLIVLPTVIVLLFKLCGASKEIIIVALGSTAMPLGLNTVVFPASCGKDTTTGASMALISNVMGVITIPLIFMLFV